MRTNSKPIELSVVGFVALAAFACDASAQTQQGPVQGFPGFRARAPSHRRGTFSK
jgi:hypothetical protein